MKLVRFRLLAVLQTTQFLSLGTYATKCFGMFGLDTAVLSSCSVSVGYQGCMIYGIGLLQAAL